MAVFVEDAAHHPAKGNANIWRDVVGQSGTESPELVLVTMPPATTRSSVAAARRRV